MELLAALHLLQLMFIANGASSGQGGPKVALSEFYSRSLCDMVDLGEEYALWVRQKVPPTLKAVALGQASAVWHTRLTGT